LRKPKFLLQIHILREISRPSMCQIGKHFGPVIGPKAQCSDEL